MQVKCFASHRGHLATDLPTAVRFGPVRRKNNSGADHYAERGFSGRYAQRALNLMCGKHRLTPPPPPLPSFVLLFTVHREAAYVHAVISVAVSSKLMEDCNSGRLPSVAICNASAKCRESGCTKEIIDYSTNTAKVLDWLHNPAQLSNMKYRQAIVHHHNRDVGRIVRAGVLDIVITSTLLDIQDDLCITRHS